MVATGAMAFLKDQGYQIPKDVSIIGYDDLLPPMTSPKLTTIKQYPGEIGKTSLDYLLRLIEGKPAGDHVVDISLNIRESTCVVSG